MTLEDQITELRSLFWNYVEQERPLDLNRHFWELTLTSGHNVWVLSLGIDSGGPRLCFSAPTITEALQKAKQNLERYVGSKS